jgi:hypothetical protein
LLERLGDDRPGILRANDVERQPAERQRCDDDSQGKTTRHDEAFQSDIRMLLRAPEGHSHRVAARGQQEHRRRDGRAHAYGEETVGAAISGRA